MQNSLLPLKSPLDELLQTFYPYYYIYQMLKVLFVTYYWPPSGKASLQWPMDIIKYIRDYNIQPFVLTVENESFTEKDDSMLNYIPDNLKVYKTKAFEPFDLYKKFTGKSKDDKLVASDTISLDNKSLSHRISIWIRMNLFVPDARIGWYPSAVKLAKRLHQENKFDAVVTIGPPHSTHLIGRKLTKLYNVKHVPVFIDPWTDIIYYKNFKRNFAALSLDNYFEKSVIKNSHKAVFVTGSTKDDFIKKYPEYKGKYEVVHWGYNEEAFIDLEKDNTPRDFKLIIHSGNIFDYQNPVSFWKNIKSRIESGQKYKIEFIGTVSQGIKNTITDIGLDSITSYTGFLNYKDMLKKIINADYLLVCVTEKRHVPGKLFEYLRTGNKIIAFGDDNTEVDNILKECNAGKCFKYYETADEVFYNYEAINTPAVLKYDRKELAKKFVKYLQ